MPKDKKSKSSSILSKKGWIGLITTQILINLPWLFPWAKGKFELPQGAATPITGGEFLYLIIALLVSVLVIFIRKVWVEIEADAVTGSANIVRRIPEMSGEVIARCWDVVSGLWTRWLALGTFKRMYLAELRFRYGLFNDKGLGLINANRLDLDKVYVELQACADVNLNNPNQNPVLRKIQDRATIWEHLRTIRPSFAMSIIGPPGSGKTTLMHHILLTFARGRQWRRRMRFRIPIFIELRKLPLFFKSQRLPTLPQLIESVWKSDPKLEQLVKRMPKNWLAERLKKGECIILWDGLDEVAEPAKRQQVRQWLDNSAINNSNYRENIFLVSARPVGYKTSPLDRAQVLEVQPFDWDDTKLFIKQWYEANEIVSNGNVANRTVLRRATEEAQDLLERLRVAPKLADLSVNPLLLTMICMVHRFHGALPGSRSQLYDEICQVLLERWRQQRGIQDKYTSQQKLQILRPLALEMMNRKVKEISESQMLSIIRGPLTIIGVSSDDAAALDFVHALRDDSGLWLERELGVWAFAHLSFQEHLCADAWVKNENSCPKKWDSLLQDSWWRETLLLFAVKTPDATPLALATLEAGVLGRALALQLLEEKINLHLGTRKSMESSLFDVLSSSDEETFVQAVEPWVNLQQNSNYARMDERRQISGWVSQAEYQAFILSSHYSDRGQLYVPHSKSRSFSGAYSAPVLGVYSNQAVLFCEWLNSKFPRWMFRLPQNESELSSSSPSEPWLAWKQISSKEFDMQEPTDEWKAYFRFGGFPFDGLKFMPKGKLNHNVQLLAENLAMAIAIDKIVVKSLASEIKEGVRIAYIHALGLENNVRPESIASVVSNFAMYLAWTDDVRNLIKGEVNAVMLKTLKDKENSSRGREARRVRCVRELLKIMTVPLDYYSARAEFRSFWMMCFDVIEEAKVAELDGERSFKESVDIQDFQNFITMVDAREKGEAPAWEGIRVIRELKIT